MVITIELDDDNANLFKKALALANMAQGTPMTLGEFAEALIVAILEDDANAHGEPVAAQRH